MNSNYKFVFHLFSGIRVGVLGLGLVLLAGLFGIYAQGSKANGPNPGGTEVLAAAPSSCDPDLEQPSFPNPPSMTLTTEGGATCPSPLDISLAVDQFNPIATGGDAFTYTVHGIQIDGPTDYTDNCSSGEDLKLYVWNIFEDEDGDAGDCRRRIRIQWRAYDKAGNFRQAQHTFTILDDTPPAFDAACEAPITLTTEGGADCPADAGISLSVGDTLKALDTLWVAGLPLTSLDGCISDNCAEVSAEVASIDIDDDGLPCQRAITVSFELRDACGNVQPELLTLTYIVIDDTAPVATAPADEDYKCLADVPEPGELAALDNCAGEIVVTGTDRDNGGAGCPNDPLIITRTWVFDDGCGNIDSVSQTITVIDDEAPTFPNPPSMTLTTEGGATCPSPLDISLQADHFNPIATGGEPFTYTVHGIEIDGPADYTDNCSSGEDLKLYVWNIFGDEDGDAGVCRRRIRIEWRAYDACGNFRQAQNAFTILDDTPPAFDAACEAPITLTTEGGADCPADAGTSLSVGDTLKAPDTFKVAGLALTTLDGCISDNCAEVRAEVASIDIDDDGLPCQRAITVSFRLSDACGNVQPELLTLTYIIIDDTAPAATAPADEGYKCLADVPAPGPLTALDNCAGEITVTGTDTDNGGAGCPRDTLIITRTWVFDDGCGNTSSVSQVITVVDDERPSFPNPPSLTLTTEGGATCPSPLDISLQADRFNPIATGRDPFTFSVHGIEIDGPTDYADNCSPDEDLELYVWNIFEDDDGDAGLCRRRIRIEWRVYDACGNFRQAQNTYTILDDTPPTAVAPDDEGYKCLADVPAPGELAALDNCAGEVTAIGTDTDNGGAGCADDPLVITRTWVFDDGCGNTSSVSQTITVIDDTPPAIQCLPSLTADTDPGVCQWESPAGSLSLASASDNCSLASISWEIEFPADSDSPTVTVAEWGFEDEGKRASNLPYTADGGIPANAGTAPLSLAGASFTAWVQGTGGGGTFAPNANTWTETGTDKYWQAVLSTSGYGSLQVSSKQQSSNTGPRDFEVEYSLDGSSWSPVPGASITSGASFSGVLSGASLPAAANDQPTLYLRWLKSSNTAVNGGTVAAAGTNRIDDIVVTGKALGGGNTLAGTDDASGTIFPLGTSTVTYTATDACGNSTQCSFTVTVEDNEAPTIDCPSAQNLELDEDCEASLPDYTSLASTGDNCSVASVEQSPAPGTIVSGVGEVSITLTVTDGSGNTAECSFTVNKLDVTPPTLVCLTNSIFLDPTGNYSLLDTDVLDFEASFDNCSGITVTGISPGSFDCDDLMETFDVLVTAQDDSGNSSTCIATITVFEGTALPEPWVGTDIGSQGAAGSNYEYSPCSQPPVFTIETGAANNSLPDDNLAFINQDFCGDFELTAKIEGISPSAWAGLLARESSAAGSKMIGVYSNLGSVIRYESRIADGANKEIKLLQRPFPFWLRIVRQGDTFFTYYSVSGSTWAFVNVQTLSMGECIDIGLAVFSDVPGVVAVGVFSNVTVRPLPSMIPIIGAPGNAATPVDQMDIRLFPNPARDIVTIDLNVGMESLSDNKTVLRLRNELGQLIEERRIDAHAAREQWDISRLAQGMYFIEVHVEGREPQVLRFMRAD